MKVILCFVLVSRPPQTTSLSQTVSQQGHGVEAVPQWMERMGYRVGLSLAEKTTKEETRFKEDLEIIKFICKVRYSSKVHFSLYRELDTIARAQSTFLNYVNFWH